MTEPSFADQTVVITGGGGGLGRGLGRCFGRAGAQVVLADVDAAAGDRAASQLRAEGLDATFVELDVRDPAQSRALVERLGAIDVWVNNAGVAHKAPAESLSPDRWDESLAVMLSGAFYCAQAVGRSMLARGRGVIVNIASVNGYQALEQRAAYCTAKAGLIMMTQSLGIEWAERGVRVVGIAPGVVLTPMVEQGLAEGTATLATYRRRIPMRRLGEVEEIADAVLYLASEDAAFVVGETLRVDGGWGAYQFF